jgi:hypothetical protein
MKWTLFHEDNYLYSIAWRTSNANQITAPCLCSALDILIKYEPQLQVQVQCWNRPSWYQTPLCNCMESHTPETIAATLEARLAERCTTAYYASKDESHTRV